MTNPITPSHPSPEVERQSRKDSALGVIAFVLICAALISVGLGLYAGLRLIP